MPFARKALEASVKKKLASDQSQMDIKAGEMRMRRNMLVSTW
jgi:hypothetical protein